MATIRQRKRGVWEVRVFAGRDRDGKPVQLSRTVKGGKKDAERVAAELAIVPLHQAARQTVAELLDAWRDLKEGGWSTYTRRDYACRAELIAQDRLGRMTLARLEVSDVDRWITRLRKSGTGEGSIRNQLQTLRAALQQAVRWGWIPLNPAALATYDRPKRTPRGVMTQDEVQRVLDAATALGPVAAAVLRLAAVTGARRSELAALKWSDLVGAELAIDSSLTVVTEEVEGERRTIVRDDPTKGGEKRQVALDPETVAMLEALREQRETLGPWMFGESSVPPRPDRIGYWWRCAREASGIDLSWRLHDLRHWSATWAIGAGYDLATVAGRLGHSDASTTLRVYAHAQTSRDSDLAVNLGQALRSGQPAPET